jgi:hypothetical protein
VRVDIRAAEKHVRVADLTRNVTAIWKPYAGIAFADLADPSGDRYDDEIQLIVTQGRRDSLSNASSLGWITFTAPGRPASSMTVSVTTAQALMTHSRWMDRPFDQLPPDLSQRFVTRAISWSAAHEIGHYLLRTSRHSSRGLMKGHLTALDVLWNEAGLVRLEPQDAEALRLRPTRASLAANALLEAPSDEP